MSIVVAAALQFILGTFGIIGFPIAFGVSAFYTGVISYATNALWFGVYGLIGVYIGAVLAGVVGASPLVLQLVFFAVADVLQAAIMKVGFVATKANPELRTKKDLLVYVIFVMLLPWVPGGLLSVYGLVFLGLIPMSAFMPVFIGWVLGGILPTPFGIPILRILTPYVKKTPAYVTRWLS